MTGRRVGLVVVGAVLLALTTGCADGAKVRQAQQTALPLSGTWRAGLFVDGYGPQGLGPGVDASATPSGAGSAAPSPSASGSPAPSASPSPSTTAGATDPQTLLASVGIRDADFATGYRVALIQGGDTLADPTLDFCGRSYPSEQHRTARRQVVLVNPSGLALGVFTEAVRYASPAYAAQALSELRDAQADCDPTTEVTFGGKQYRVHQDSTDALDVGGLLPEPQRVAYAVTLDDTSGETKPRLLALYQVRGSLLVGLYFQHPAGDEFTEKDRTNFHALAATVATRLRALDAAAAGSG